MNADTQTSASGAVAAPPIRPSKPDKSPKPDKLKSASTVTIVKTPNGHAVQFEHSDRLEQLAGEIRESHASIGALTISAKEKVAETLAEVVRCGKLLSECKTIIGHGGWLKWLGKNCAVSPDRAQVYIRVSEAEWSNTARARYLEEPKSIRQALALLSDGKSAASTKKTKPSSGAKGGHSGEAPLRRIVTMVGDLAHALRDLSREQQTEALEALEEIREWMDSVSIPV